MASKYSYNVDRLGKSLKEINGLVKEIKKIETAYYDNDEISYSDYQSRRVSLMRDIALRSLDLLTKTAIDINVEDCTEISDDHLEDILATKRDLFMKFLR